eukprot:scaffold18892_cov183-Isochrysis_galbana.AAC.2
MAGGGIYIRKNVHAPYLAIRTPKCVLSRIIWAICHMLRFRAVCCLRWAPALHVQHCVLCRLPPWCTLLYARSKHCLPTAYLHASGRQARGGYGDFGTKRERICLRGGLGTRGEETGGDRQPPTCACQPLALPPRAVHQAAEEVCPRALPS